MSKKQSVQKIRNYIKGMILVTFCAISCSLYVKTAAAAALGLQDTSVKVGKQISFDGNITGYSFKSSDEQVAYVSRDGIVTGKKQGKVIITAVKSGKKQKYSLTVKANGRKPAVKVCFDELIVETPKVVNRNGVNIIAFAIKNNSQKGTVKKVTCSYRCNVICEVLTEEEEISEDIEKDVVIDSKGDVIEEDGDNNVPAETVIMDETISVTFGKILPGEREVIYYSKLDGLLEMQEENLQSLSLYSGEAKLQWNPDTAAMTYGWGTKDVTAPVIKGFVGKNSYNGSDVYIVLYKDRKTKYKKYVTAYDERDGKVAVKADFSEIDWTKKGNYMVTVTARDKAGNQAKKKMKVQVRCLTGIDAYADTILKRITKSGWSDKEKCKAIYRYVQSHMSYIDYNGGKSWESAALRGLRYGNGNCYAYYSLSRLLLTRAGIPNLMITRYPAVPNHHHWWNLAYVKGGWYHFDTTPRRLKGHFCLLTDSQLRIYERRSPGTFRYANSAYPKRAMKTICSGPF